MHEKAAFAGGEEVKKITYNFLDLALNDMVVTDDRTAAIHQMRMGKHLYCLPQMFGSETGLFILGVPQDKQAHYLETTQSLTTKEAEEHLSALEKSSREQCGH